MRTFAAVEIPEKDELAFSGLGILSVSQKMCI